MTLTIDHQIQANAEQILAADGARLGRPGSDGDRDGPAHRCHPRDGELPDVRREPLRNGVADARRNRAVTDAYEPGSTFKIVTIAGALEDNVVSPRTTFTLPPTIQVADRVIHEAHSRRPSG